MNKILTKYFIVIAGNIGVGKSTMIQYLQTKYKNNHKVKVLQEPVDEWTMMTDDNGVSILSNYYLDPVKFSFTFQVLVLETMKNFLNCYPVCARRCKQFTNIRAIVQHC